MIHQVSKNRPTPQTIPAVRANAFILSLIVSPPFFVCLTKIHFASSGSIDRIRHGEFLIIFKSKDNFLFGYVFKGQSYSAISKLKEFVEKLYKEKDIIKELTLSANGYTEISNKINMVIDQICNKIFFE